MAPPKNPEAENRDVVARFRLTASEKLRFWQDAKSNGKTPSDYFRGLAFNAKPVREVPTLDRELLLKMLAELNKNGSNLNQIARAHNRMREDGEAIDISETVIINVINNVDIIAKQLMEILKK